MMADIAPLAGVKKVLEVLGDDPKTAAQVAESLGVNVTTARRYLISGWLKGYLFRQALRSGGGNWPWGYTKIRPPKTGKP